MKTKRVRLERFRKFLDTKVRARGPKKFHMGTWADGKFKNKSMACGTVACAFGHATVLWPNSLKLIEARSGNGYYNVKYGRLINYLAAAKFFGISLWSAYHIFDPGEYTACVDAITIDDVIRHIDNVLERLV